MDLGAVLDALDDGVVVRTPDGVIVYANRSAGRPWGVDRPEALVGRRAADLGVLEACDDTGHPLGEERRETSALFEGAFERPEALLRRPGSEARPDAWWRLATHPVVLAPGERRFVLNVFRDVTRDREAAAAATRRLEANSQIRLEEEQRARERQRFLADAAILLASTPAWQEALEGLARLAVPALADWCLIDLVNEDDTVDRVVAAHADPAHAPLAEALRRRYAPKPDIPHGVSRAIARGEPQLVSLVTDDLLEQLARDPAHLTALRALKMTSFATAPLLVRAQIIGTITFASSHRLHDAGDLELLVDLARRAALVIQNVRLHAERQSTVERLGQLQVITSALSMARAPAEVAEVAVRRGAEAARARSGALWASEPDGSLRLIASHGLPAESIATLTRLAAADGTPGARAVRSGAPIWVETGETIARTEGPRSALQVRGGPVASVARVAELLFAHAAIPMVVEGRCLGLLAFGFEEVHRFSPEERVFLMTLSQHAAQAFERARLLEAESLARRDAEAANRAKDEFLAMLGHELRNPLAPILTALHLLRLKVDSGGERECAVIERQVGHMTRLVDDLLDISRITRGTVHLAPRRMELAEAVAAALETASPLIEQRAHHLDVTVPDAGLPVLADGHRLAQAIGNVITNAAKYTPRGGHLQVTAHPDRGRAVLRIRDDGVGIPADLLPRVFDLFVQGKRTSERAEGGLGLGLAIARSLVQLHGGTLTAHSDGMGTGATLTLELPLAGEAITSVGRGASAESAPRSPRSARVLVVDDNTDAAEMLAAILTLFGYQTATAHDGPTALELAIRFKPNAALLDLGLPVMDGFELARRLRTTPGLEGIRLVAVTGYGMASDREQSRNAGFDLHLVKPIQAETIEAVLAELL